MSFWDGLSESLGETWDVVVDVGGEVIKKGIQATKESAADPEKLRQSEPEKGKNADGSTVVGQPAMTSQVLPPSPQYIQGVDNTLVLIGGGMASLVVLVLVIKAVK